MRQVLRATVLTAGVLTAGLADPRPAGAADLGGDCCADLEERIAELEATAVRKGNRKVKLEISGQVNQAILAWDDGAERNVYQVMNSNSADRFRFTGTAEISRDLKAGYFLELGLRTDSTGRADQFGRGLEEDDLGARQSVWFVESKTFGVVTVGRGSPATDDIITYNLGGTNVAGSANAPLVGGNFFTRDSAVDTLNSLASGNTISLRWRRFFEQLDTRQANMVRYDSPTFMGFAASASWGDDDYWDVALRYARFTRDFKVAFGIGYLENLNEEANTLGWPGGGDTEPNAGDTKIRELKGSASLLHEPTGLFVSGAYVHREFDGDDLGVVTFACFGSAYAALIQGFVDCGNRPDFDYYWISGGLRQKWLSFGETSIYGEYARSEDAVTGLNVAVASAVGGDIDYVTESSLDMWGVGLVQQIRPAAMEVYFSYRHLEADVRGLETTGDIVSAPLDDIDLFMAGSRIRF
jgi:hypothetical protein